MIHPPDSDILFAISMEDLEATSPDVLGRDLMPEEVARLKRVMEADWLVYKRVLKATLAAMFPAEAKHDPNEYINGVDLPHMTSIMEDIYDLEEEPDGSEG